MPDTDPTSSAARPGNLPTHPTRKPAGTGDASGSASSGSQAVQPATRPPATLPPGCSAPVRTPAVAAGLRPGVLSPFDPRVRSWVRAVSVPAPRAATRGS